MRNRKDDAHKVAFLSVLWSIGVFEKVRSHNQRMALIVYVHNMTMWSFKQ